MDVGRYTLERVKPNLRPALVAGILDMAEDAADQIGDDDREAVISAVLGRFANWLTAVPTARRLPRPAQIPLPLVNEPLEERRRQVLLHMGIRFSGMLQRLQVLDGGALAMIWREGLNEEYQYDPPHPDRDGQIYLVRSSWAFERGLIQPGPAGFVEDVPGPGVEHYCRCHGQWLFNLRDLPDALLTALGQSELAQARLRIALLQKRPN
jgi:hypothetical protein